MTIYKTILKPLLDKLAALVLLVVLSPVLLIGACLAVLASGGLPVFCHQRPGLHGKPFQLFKLRTMRPSQVGGRKLSNIERINPIGHFLRNSSIDELPQLVNVLQCVYPHTEEAP